MEFRSAVSVMGSVNGKVVSVMGPNNYQINSLGIFSGNDPVKNCRLSAPQRCNAERSDAQRNFFASLFIPPYLQRHRCDALPCFSASPVIIFYIAHIAFPPLLPFSFRRNGLLYKTTRNAPRVTTQRCRHWQRGMAITNANAAMRCT